jgi:hypothetical protein
VPLRLVHDDGVDRHHRGGRAEDRLLILRAPMRGLISKCSRAAGPSAHHT